MVVLMEGEALLNDASAVTLYTVFLHILKEASVTNVMPSVPSQIWPIIKEILRCTTGGHAGGRELGPTCSCEAHGGVARAAAGRGEGSRGRVHLWGGRVHGGACLHAPLVCQRMPRRIPPAS